jgi:hypothetical protein
MVLNKSLRSTIKGINPQLNAKLTWAAFILTGIILGIIVVLNTDFHAESIESSNKIERLLLGSKEEFKKQSFLIYIIDFNDFMCMSCLNSFLEFYHILPPPFQNERSLGILVDDHQNQQKNRSKSQKIIKKKLTGFIKANQIGFPIFIDSSGIFKYLSDNGTAVIIFSEALEMSRTYTFPLSFREKEEIFNTLF